MELRHKHSAPSISGIGVGEMKARSEGFREAFLD